ncbi:unnamed protein product [Schistosoma rodhaini]|uniref:t-SNARE coiled-coil homology domain-containing protein n=1 Tax=Schistosoma rodhaini TaxID=6188 RepID=A0AA85F7S6_9TREM|nr:unnamed protein product [Schistosoma rodhaini]CAH8483777.1 unnamed protein product [Schistosoma rodhaini]
MSTNIQAQVDVIPTIPNMFIINTVNHLVDRINILSEQVYTCMKISEQFINHSLKSINMNGTHATYVHNRSVQYIIRKLLRLKQSNQNVIKSLYRYQCYMEKLIFDIRQETERSNQTEIKRIKSRRSKNVDTVQQVAEAEYQLLKNLKCSLESKLHLLFNTIKDVKCVQCKLDQWIIEHEQSTGQFKKCDEIPEELTTIDSQVEVLNESYSTSLNLENISKIIDSTLSHVNTLQLDLTITFEKIQQVINGTRNSVFYALTDECTFLTKQMHRLFLSSLKHKVANNRNLKMMNQIMSKTPNKSNKKLLQKLLQNNEEIQTVRSELTMQYNRINQYLQADLNTIRTRHRYQGEQLLHLNNLPLSPIITKINLEPHRL